MLNNLICILIEMFYCIISPKKMFGYLHFFKIKKLVSKTV